MSTGPHVNRSQLYPSDKRGWDAMSRDELVERLVAERAVADDIYRDFVGQRARAEDAEQQLAAAREALGTSTRLDMFTTARVAAALGAVQQPPEPAEHEHTWTEYGVCYECDSYDRAQDKVLDRMSWKPYRPIEPPPSPGLSSDDNARQQRWPRCESTLAGCRCGGPAASPRFCAGASYRPDLGDKPVGSPSLGEPAKEQQ